MPAYFETVEAVATFGLTSIQYRFQTVSVPTSCELSVNYDPLRPNQHPEDITWHVSTQLWHNHVISIRSKGQTSHGITSEPDPLIWINKPLQISTLFNILRSCQVRNSDHALAFEHIALNIYCVPSLTERNLSGTTKKPGKTYSLLWLITLTRTVSSCSERDSECVAPAQTFSLAYQ